MNRDDAINLLKGNLGGGIEEFNDLRAAGETVPSLDKADFRSDSFHSYYPGTLRALVVDLKNLILSGVDFYDAKLQRAELDGSDLSSADLREAKLNRASLVNVSLEKARLQGATLSDANLRGANLAGAELEGVILNNVRNLRLNGNDISKVRFPPNVDEAWHIVRRTYTGSAMVFHLLLMIVFFGVLAFKAATWIGIGSAQRNADRTLQQVEENLRKDVVVNRQVRGVDITVEMDLDNLADVVKDTRAKMFPADSQVPVWKVLLELNKGWGATFVAAALLFYNLLRIILTKNVGAMREEAERSGFAPVWKGNVPPAYAPIVVALCKWRPIEAFRTVIIGHSSGYALYYRLHQAARLLMWVAIASFLWHLYRWLNETVWVPAMFG